MPINFQPYNPNQIVQANLLQAQLAAQQQALEQRGLQAAMEAQQFAQQQARAPIEQALNDQLRQLTIQAQTQKLNEANKPLEDQLKELFAKTVIEKGLYSQIPTVQPSMTAEIGALGEVAGIPVGLQAPGLNEAIAERMKPAPVTIPGLPAGMQIDLNAPTARSIDLANARKTETSRLYELPDPNDPTKVIRGYFKPSEAPENATAYIRPPATGSTGRRSVLAEDENGRLTNVVLDPGQSLPEGFKEHVKASAATSDPQKLRKEFNALQVVKDFRAINPQYQRMQQAIEESKTTNNFTAVDQTLINTFNRILDPQSVVRESEYARTASDQSVLDYLKGKFDPDTGKLVVGGAGLTPDTRAAMIRMAERFINTSRSNFDQTANFYENAAIKSNIDPELVIQGIEEVRQRASPETAAPGTPASSSSSITTKSGNKFQLAK